MGHLSIGRSGHGGSLGPVELPLEISAQVSTLESRLASSSDLTYEAEVIDQVRRIDELCARQSFGTDQISLLLLLGFEPSSSGAHLIRSPTGSSLRLDGAAAGGRIVLGGRTRTPGSWRFDRGWLFDLGPSRLARGAPGNVLLVSENLRRG